MKTPSSIRTLLVAASLPLFAWPGAGTAEAAPGESVLAWGNNDYGKATVPVAAQRGVTAIAAGSLHTVALKNDGSVLSWGNSGQAAVPVAAQSGVTAIGAGVWYTVALKGDGSVVMWGSDGVVQAVPAAAQSGVIAISAGGYHTVALKSNGTVVAWGDNSYGQTTVPVAARRKVAAISAGGRHTLVLKNDGSVVAWGENWEGQTTVPVAAQSGVIAIAAGGYHSVALKTGGSVVVWGNNGQTTVPVAAQSGVIAIAAGWGYTVALKNDGSVVAWGSDDSGQTTVPVAAKSGVTAIAAGSSHTVALVIPIAPAITTPPMSQTVSAGQAASFTVATTGYPLNYQWRKDGIDIGGATGATFSVDDAFGHAGSYTVVVSNHLGSVTSTPPAVLTVNATAPVIGTPPMSVTVNAGQGASFTVAATGYAVNYQWRKDGVNISGATGTTYRLIYAAGSDAGSYTVEVSNPIGSVTSTPPAVLTVDAALPGTMVAWGNNDYYGATTVPVAARSGVTAIAAGSGYTVALKDGGVQAWGYNDYGQTNVPVAAQSGVTAIAAGWAHTVALKNDGSVLSWGYYYYYDDYYYAEYDYGQTSVPVAAQSEVTAIAAGPFHTVALKSDGSVLAWRPIGFSYSYYGDYYDEGDYGQTTVPVAAQSGVTAIAAGGYHTVALKNDGSVVAWGNNGSGQTTVPVAAQSGVTAIAAGNAHTVALKNDGSVVAWGYNFYGQTTVPPAAQGGVIEIAAGGDCTVALKSDGSVVAWGANGSGQTTVPVAAQSGVTAIAAGGGHTVALLGTTQPSFARWIANFGLSGTADGDPDHDGLASALEYILGGNPAQPSPTTPLLVDSISVDKINFRFFRADESETPDMTLRVESGTDLVTWPDVFTIGADTDASSRGVTIVENGTDPDTITVAIPAGSGNARFARLKATIAP